MERNPFDRYVDDIINSSKLSADEEYDLSLRIQSGDKRAIDRLTTANLKFVIVLSRQYQGRGVDIDDLIAEGNIALFKAAGKFDATKNSCRFTSYAAPFVHKALEESVRKYVNNTIDSDNSKLMAFQKVSIDGPVHGYENVSYHNLLPNADSPLADSMLNLSSISDRILTGLKLLNEREKNVIVMYFGIGCEKHTMAEIGDLLELKRERVRQIRDKALRKMRKNN